ncbi:hypothetical protein BJY04DRAFT_215560 [Aspergillus karnatakaensis]|uniref:LysM peptidoglycan-binding domain-containing protein n=1 Tax=Aspergillus karnatakaensis TaxID=1810916 RepID=UPI003CCE380A
MTYRSLHSFLYLYLHLYHDHYYHHCHRNDYPEANIASGDQCDAIEAKYGITNAQFSSWNPYIDKNSSNLWLDYYVCVHVTPKPQMPDIVDSCKTYHKVSSGEGCWSIDSAYGITLDQFRKWNPTIDASCSNLWVDYYVCVGV